MLSVYKCNLSMGTLQDDGLMMCKATTLHIYVTKIPKESVCHKKYNPHIITV